MIGSMDEARELYDALGSGFWGDLPEGWERIGRGGTRVAYRSPTGVCYKICYSYSNDEPSSNDIEHKNFHKIARSNRLRSGWRVPKSHLHVFNCDRNWVRNEGTIAREGTRIAILACEYVANQWHGEWTEEERNECNQGFWAVGLFDSGRHNAVRADDGTWYIIDAAENELVLE